MWLHWVEVEEESQEHWVHILNAAQCAVQGRHATTAWKTAFLFLAKP